MQINTVHEERASWVLNGKRVYSLLNSKAYKLVYLYIINPDSVIWFTVEIAEFDQSVNELKY